MNHVQNANGFDKSVHPLFMPYCKQATIIRPDGSYRQIQTLRDTGAMQSLIRDDHNSNDYTHTGEIRLLKGITNEIISVPLVEVKLHTDFTEETVLCGLVKDLPDGIDFLIGNDIWLKSHPLPDEVIEQAIITRATSRKNREAQDTAKPVQNESQSSLSTDNNTNEHSSDTKHSVPEEKMLDIPLLSETSMESITDRNQLINLQKSDINMKNLRKKAVSDEYKNENSYYFLQDEMLMHHLSDKKTNFSADRIVVPTALRLQILQLAHDIPAAGHLGIRKTMSRLQPHFFWPHMHKYVIHYCKSCDKCQRQGKGRRIPPAPLVSVPLMSEPWTRIAIDIVGPLPPCPKTGNRFILTCIDMASHYPEAIPIKRHTAEDIANALAQIFAHFGFPEEILSDQGTKFMSELIQHFVHQFGITQIRCCPYHPETNGSCERFHRTLKSMIRAMVDDFSDSWCECLPWTLFAYREVPVETLGFSPFELMHGYPVRGPLALVQSTWLQNPPCTGRTNRAYYITL